MNRSGWHLYFCRNQHPQVHGTSHAHKDWWCCAGIEGCTDETKTPLRLATPAEQVQYALLQNQWDCVPLEDSCCVPLEDS